MTVKGQKNHYNIKFLKPSTDQIKPKDLLCSIWEDNGFGPYDEYATPEKITEFIPVDHVNRFSEIRNIIEKINS